MSQITPTAADGAQSVSTQPGGSNRNDISSDRTALVIDLDGTLARTDVLYESFFASATLGLNHYVSVIEALRRGKPQLKAYLAQVATVDYSSLPYNQAVLDLAREAKAGGRPVYLAPQATGSMPTPSLHILAFSTGCSHPTTPSIFRARQKLLNWSRLSERASSTMSGTITPILPSGSTRERVTWSAIHRH